VLSLSPSLSKEEYLTQSYAIKTSASRAHDKIIHMPILIPPSTSPTPDLVFETIRLTSLDYLSCLSCTSPFSLALSPLKRKVFYETLHRVPLSAWKKIPGVYMWVLLVVCPGSGNDAISRLMRRNISMTAIFMTFVNLGLSTGCLEGFWRVQRWIQRVRELEDEMEMDAEGNSEDVK
jgi:hypothetical protein